MAKIEDRIQLLRTLSDKELKTMEAKAHDYSGSGDCNRNILACERLGICNAETGILIRIQDKMARLTTLLANGETAKVAEPIEDTISDARNYLLILYHVWLDKKSEVK